MTKRIPQVGADEAEIRFKKIGRAKFIFISKLWTQEFFDTFADVGFERFICRVKLERKKGMKQAKWGIKLISRDLVHRGKRRI